MAPTAASVHRKLQAPISWSLKAVWLVSLLRCKQSQKPSSAETCGSKEERIVASWNSLQTTSLLSHSLLGFRGFKKWYLHLLDSVSFPPRTVFDSSVQVHYIMRRRCCPRMIESLTELGAIWGARTSKSLGELWSGCTGLNFKSEKYVFRTGRCSNKLHIMYISVILL